MTKPALFVDLTNFYSQLIKSDLDTAENLRNYFTEWFDFSFLSQAITNEICDVWIFYSRERLGSKDAQITDKYLKNLIERFNSQKGVTARNVNIQGEQREPYKLRCEKCGNETDALWKSEKGIDSSLIVHLFDTMESWDVAYLLSGDADFVPAVKSLRRRGKVINGAGFSKRASSALVRECFDYVDLYYDFIRKDFFCYKFCKDDGIFWKYISEIQPKSKNNKESIEVRIRRIENEKTKELNVELASTHNRDLTSWEEEFSNVLGSWGGGEGGGRKSTREETTVVYKFNPFFAKIVGNRLIYLLSKTDFGSWRTYYQYPREDERIEESELIFRWNNKKRKYESFYPAEIEGENSNKD